MPHLSLVLAVMLVPLVVALLASRDVRASIRGTGSVRQTLSNAGVGALFLLVQLVLRGSLLAAFATLASFVPYKLPSVPWAYVLAFVMLDFVYYVQHRLEHAVPLLWAIHSVHHQSADYNLSVSLRVGMLSSLSTLLFHGLLALGGVSATMYAVVVTIHATLLFTLHSRTKFALGPGRLFNAPVFHRVHHGADAASIDKNFGGVLLVFDRLFGTFAPYVKEPSFGVAGESAPANPVAANVAPFTALFGAVRRQKGAWRKLRALFVRS